ncbi:MAG: sigma-70 family RNA polymerase sigma factor [Clostridia bacterium]|nr:sigma-70 family RNA polymerase sigma factor [Clostridia bacterium]
MTETREITADENLGLVHSIAHRFKGRGIEYDDLFSAGCLGLVKAIERFDQSRGLCFSTYAVPLIMGEIKGLFRRGGALKVSRSLKELALKAQRAGQDYINRMGVEPTVTELSKMIEATEEQTIEALCACRQPLSLTVSEDDSDDISQIDIAVESGEEKLAERLSLEHELSKLSEDDRQLILLRYYKGLTQSQTAKIMGTSQVQISRKEKKILCTLREKLS